MNKKDLEFIQSSRLKFDKISESARERIYQIVLKHFQKNPVSPWSGKPLLELEQAIKAFYSEMGLEYTEVFRDTLPKTMQKYYDTAVAEMKKAGVRRNVIGKPDAQRIKYFMESSFEQVAMKTQKMSFDHIKHLRTIAADVTRQMSLTGNTRKEVSKAMLNKAMEIPNFQFTDNAGHKWQAKSYFDMLARTELMNAARASYDDKCAKEGFDVVELTYSGHSCDACDRWEGRLFSLTGATRGLPTKDDLIADGVFHPNCTHSYTLVPQAVFEEDFNADGTPKTAEQKSSSKGKLYQAQGSRFAESTTVIHDGSGNYPKGGKYEKIRPFYNAALKGEESFIAKVREIGFSEEFPREFAGVWDETGKLVEVSMGRVNANSVQFHLIPNSTVIHSHPKNYPPSPQDIHQFIHGDLKAMKIITKEGEFCLTNRTSNSKLSATETSSLILEKFRETVKSRKLPVATLEEWEKILDGTSYKISYRNV